MPAVRRTQMLILALCAALALAIAGCGGDEDSTTDGTTTQEAAAPSSGSEDTSKKPKVTVPDGPPPKQLEEVDLVEGDGAEAKAGDEVTVQYVGVGYDSKEEFDASWGREPFTFPLGAGAVIPGWDEGVEGMKVGGRRELTIPPNLAYGAAGSPPVIGPNETLIFVVDLVAVS
jgi:peptidylprolyl isomerase